jgi:Pyridoxamine 5'-phosphate oxidase
MTDREPMSAEPMIEAASPTAWATALSTLEGERSTYWVATVRPGGAPHVMPVLAVWVDGGLFLSAGAGTRKARNLARDPHCVVTVEQEPLDLVVEGRAAKVHADETLRSVADAYGSIYGWHVSVRDGAFHDTEGAPTAGPPPYDVYEIVPSVAFGFGTDETLIPTRWLFAGRDAPRST